MSTIAERARIEAEAAEAAEQEGEMPEPEPTPEPEPEPEPEPAPGPPQMTEQEAEREFGKLERLAQTYLTKAMPITEKLGMPVQACPLCTFPGLAIPRGAHEVTSDIEGAVLALIGREVEPQFPEFAGFKQCPTCKGTGDVLTGAVIERSRHTTCPNPLCGGKGYVTVSLDPAPATPANGFPGSEVTYTPLPQGIPDAWNRPAGHPHWGRDPREIGV